MAQVKAKISSPLKSKKLAIEDEIMLRLIRELPKRKNKGQILDIEARNELLVELNEEQIRVEINEMKLNGIPPNLKSYNSLLKKLKSPSDALLVFNYMKIQNVHPNFVSLQRINYLLENSTDTKDS